MQAGFPSFADACASFWPTTFGTVTSFEAWAITRSTPPARPEGGPGARGLRQHAAGRLLARHLRRDGADRQSGRRQRRFGGGLRLAGHVGHTDLHWSARHVHRHRGRRAPPRCPPTGRWRSRDPPRPSRSSGCGPRLKARRAQLADGLAGAQPLHVDERPARRAAGHDDGDARSAFTTLPGVGDCETTRPLATPMLAACVATGSSPEWRSRPTAAPSLSPTTPGRHPAARRRQMSTSATATATAANPERPPQPPAATALAGPVGEVLPDPGPPSAAVNRPAVGATACARRLGPVWPAPRAPASAPAAAARALQYLDELVRVGVALRGVLGQRAQDDVVQPGRDRRVDRARRDGRRAPA